MSVVINTNHAATLASANLASSSAALQRSLNRLSSGSKIVTPQDDAAGLAVSMKLTATARRQNAAATNIGNAVSFLQTQDGALSVAGKVMSRIGELKTLYTDPTKNGDDLANYQAEFRELQTQLTSLGSESFNGVNLFGSAGLSLAVTAEGSTGATVSFGAAALMGVAANPIFSDDFSDLSQWPIGSGSPSVAGNELVLESGEAISSSQAFGGVFEVNFTVQLSGPGAQVRLGFLGGGVSSELEYGGLINDTAAHSVRVVFDGTGSASTYLDGSSTVAQTRSLLSDNIGLVLENMGTSTGYVSDFSANDGTGTASSTATVANAADLGALNLSDVTAALQQIATLRASNGAEQSRLQFASEVLTVNKANIEAANSRLSDVDVAQESTALARYNILVQSGTAMLSQANQSSQTALRLLG